MNLKHYVEQFMLLKSYSIFLFLNFLFVSNITIANQFNILDSISFYKEKGDKNWEAGLYDRALDYNLKRLKLIQKIGNTMDEIDINIDLGISMMYLNDIKLSLNYYSEAEKLLNKHPSDSLKVKLLINRAEIYTIIGEIDKAKKSLLAAEILEQKVNHLSSIVAIRTIYADCFFLEGNYEEAIRILNQILDLKLTIKERAITEYRLSEAYNMIKDYNSAILHGEKAVQLSKKNNQHKTMQVAYGQLADAYSSLNKFETSLKYEFLYSEMKDSLSREFQKNQQKQLEAEYRFERQNDKIRILEQNEEIVALEKNIVQRKLNTIVLLALILLLIAVITIVMYRRKKHFSDEMQQAKEYAEKQKKLKEIFLSNTSHEIRGPLHALLGNVDLLEKKGSFAVNVIANIKNSGNHLLCLVNDILDISKIEAGMFELEILNTNIRKELKSIIDLYSIQTLQKELELELVVSDDVPTILRLDPIRLKQILINLIDNAVKFTHEGFIQLSVDINLEAQYLIFKVQDSGIGIPSDKLGSIFDQYTQEGASTTRNFGGTGLGLSISKQLIELMGGTISVQSEKFEGTEFNFIIPFEIEEAEEFTSSNFQLVDLSKMKVLVIDDNKLSGETLANQVQFLNGKCTFITDGRDGVELIQIGNFELIFLDINLPYISGIEITKVIRMMPEIKQPIIIAISGFSNEKTRKNAIESGMDGYIQKPFNINDLSTMIEKFFVLKSLSSSLKENKFENKKMIEEFNSEVPQLLNEIEKYLQSNDLNKLKFLIHKIKPCYFYIEEFDSYNLIDAVESKFEELSLVELEKFYQDLKLKTQEIIRNKI